jgi:Methyltransferase domain
VRPVSSDDTFSPRASLHFFGRMVTAELVALAAAFAFAAAGASVSVTLLGSVVAAGGTASLFRLPLPWILICAALPPAFTISQAESFNPYWYLVGLFGIGAVFLPAIWTRVPYYPTASADYEVILSQLPYKPGVRFIDLGCGSGKLLVFLARRAVWGNYTGVELAPMTFAFARVFTWIFAKKNNVTIRFGDLSRVDLSEYDVVFAFLSPAAMPKLWEKVRCEMKSGSIFVTSCFAAPAPATNTFEGKNGPIMVHRM